MKNILIIGDSSALSREDVYFTQTYYFSIKSIENINIENAAVSNNNSYKIHVNLEAFMLYGYKPDIVILNYGIVDVYPRPYPNKMYRLFSCTGVLPYVDKFLKKTKLYYKLGDLFKFQEVNIEKFESNTQSIIEKLLKKNVKKVIIIGIIKPYKVLLNSKIANDEIVNYNKVYKKLSKKYSEVEYIDIYNDSTADFTIWDGYHYSIEASQYLADRIGKLILDD